MNRIIRFRCSVRFGSNLVIREKSSELLAKIEKTESRILNVSNKRAELTADGIYVVKDRS